MVYQVLARGRAVASVDLAQQDHARARRAREHSEKGEELFVTIGREQLFAYEVDVPEGKYRAEYRKDEQNIPVGGKQGQLNGGNARNDHQIERETADAIHHVVVYDAFLDHFFVVQLIEDRLCGNGEDDAYEEVEAEQRIRERGQQRRKPVHDPEGDRIHGEHERELYGHLVHRGNGGQLVVVFIVRKSAVPFRRIDFNVPLFAHYVDINDAADARNEKAECRNGKPEVRAVFKAVLIFVDLAVIERLPGSLTESEGEQDSRRADQSRNVDHPCGYDRNDKTHRRKANRMRAG